MILYSREKFHHSILSKWWFPTWKCFYPNSFPCECFCRSSSKFQTIWSISPSLSHHGADHWLADIKSNTTAKWRSKNFADRCFSFSHYHLCECVDFSHYLFFIWIFFFQNFFLHNFNILLFMMICVIIVRPQNGFMNYIWNRFISSTTWNCLFHCGNRKMNLLLQKRMVWVFFVCYVYLSFHGDSN